MRRRPSNVYRIAQPGNVATVIGGYRVQKCSTNEDEMAEIVMTRGRGELRASGLTTVGCVAQGQR